MTLTEIEKLTRSFADAHGRLSALVAELNDQVEKLKHGLLPGIKGAVNAAADRRAALAAAIEGAPELFEKPRTQVFHGVKVGYQKGRGGVEWDDADSVVERIEKLFPDRVDELIRFAKSPNKPGLATLSVVELKRLGCSLVDAGDEIVIRPTDSDVDRIVTALLREAAEQR